MGHGGVAHSDVGHAGLGLPGHEVHHLLGHVAVGRALEDHGGGVLETVFQRDAPDGQGLKDMRIFVFQHVVSLLKCACRRLRTAPGR